MLHAFYTDDWMRCLSCLHIVVNVQYRAFKFGTWVDGRHLEKWKNRNISATTWPILMKFGMQMGPMQLVGC